MCNLPTILGNKTVVQKSYCKSTILVIFTFKVRTFWEAHKIWKKSSSWFWHLLSKSADLSKPWGRFIQILCVSQKVRTLPWLPPALPLPPAPTCLLCQSEARWKKSFLARIFFLDSSFPACCHEHAVRDECTYKEHLVHYCFSFNESQKKIWMHSGQCLNRWWNYGEFSKSHSFIEWICIKSSLCSDYWLKRHFLQEFLKNFCDIFFNSYCEEFQLEKSNGFGILLEFFKNSDPSVNSEQKMKHTK